MEWDKSLIDKLDAAFNEADVRGFTFDATTNEARLLLEVLALPEQGSVDPDLRRVIVMSGVGRVDIRLRLDEPEPGSLIPMPSLEALQRFFTSLTFAHSMYGWEFIDVQEPNQWWSGETSLTVASGAATTSSHTLRWFTECGNGSEAYTLGATVAFADMAVERADGSPIPLRQFADNGARWWSAFNARDPRVSGAAQQATSQSAQVWWPDRGTQSAVVPAGEWDSP